MVGYYWENMPREYMHYWYEAPDGIYCVWVNKILEPEKNFGVVNFPLYEHSPSELHGDFKFNLDVELIEYCTFEIWLKNNIIVYALMIQKNRP